MAHSEFVHQAIQNADTNTGVFQGVDIRTYCPGVGDIIQHNRGGNTFTFDFARNNISYVSHAVIVLEIGPDTQGGFAFCVGANESDSIRRTVIRLNNNGFIKQRTGNPFICVINNLK